MAAIQIKHVPGALHDAARARAAREGMSLSAYVLTVLERELALPTQEEWFEQIDKAEPIAGDFDVAAAIREAREERDEQLQRATRRR
jgi:antitoxin FitA